MIIDNQKTPRTIDYYGTDASRLCRKRLFLLDMDGTIYEENRLFEGTCPLLDQIAAQGGIYVFITNNSSKSVRDYIRKVNAMGISADRENFFTSTQAAALYLKENHPDALVYCQGTRSFVSELEESGIRVTEEAGGDADVILVGFDLELTSAKLEKTCRLLQNPSLPFIAANPDLACPVSFGFVPDCGSICQMLENATGRKPVYIGKPEPAMIDIVREKFHMSAEETVVIGDRLYTDIASGINAKVDTVCVLSGEATCRDIQESAVKPDFVFRDVGEIALLLSENRK